MYYKKLFTPVFTCDYVQVALALFATYQPALLVADDVLDAFQVCAHNP